MPKTIIKWPKVTIQSTAKACILKNPHLAFITFWLINSEANVGYTLWWDGGNSTKMYIRDRAHQTNCKLHVNWSNQRATTGPSSNVPDEEGKVVLGFDMDHVKNAQ